MSYVDFLNLSMEYYHSHPQMPQKRLLDKVYHMKIEKVPIFGILMLNGQIFS